MTPGCRSGIAESWSTNGGRSDDVQCQQRDRWYTVNEKNIGPKTDPCGKSQGNNAGTSSYSAFSLFRVSAFRFQYPRSPVLCVFSLYSFRLHVFSYNITPPQLRSSYRSVPTHLHLPWYHYCIFWDRRRQVKGDRLDMTRKI